MPTIDSVKQKILEDLRNGERLNGQSYMKYGVSYELFGRILDECQKQGIITGFNSSKDGRGNIRVYYPENVRLR